MKILLLIYVLLCNNLWFFSIHEVEAEDESRILFIIFKMDKETIFEWNVMRRCYKQWCYKAQPCTEKKFNAFSF